MITRQESIVGLNLNSQPFFTGTNACPFTLRPAPFPVLEVVVF